MVARGNNKKFPSWWKTKEEAMRLFRKAAAFLSALVLVAGVGTLTAQQAAAAGWQPRKPIEFIIMAGTGGGADQMARLMQSIIEKHDFSNQPFIPINKPGGSGAEALRYLKDKSGDNHVVMITLNSFYTTPLLNPGLGVDITQFTPIARMALDTFVLWVNSDTDIHSLNEWVKAVKDANGRWKMGGTGKGQEDELLTHMLEDQFNLKITYVPFPGGGTVAKNLIGKHIDSTVNNPAEQLGFFEAGRSRPLVAFTPQRLPQFPDTPTARELGFDLVYFMQRSINGPPGMSPDAQQYYVDLFGKVFHSKEWQDFCTNEGLFCEEFLAGKDLAKFHEEELAIHKKILKGMGDL
jgi:putative tricarboxylic transport membrane protein